jgi:hypothetical protein
MRKQQTGTRDVYAVCKEVAAATILELESTGAGRATVQYYLANKPGARDFVWIEETVSGGLTDRGVDGRAAHIAACGMVFGWLLVRHGVTAPRWYGEAVVNGEL